MWRWIFVFSLGLLIGCGSAVSNKGKTVGGPCTANTDCDERCLTGGDFPGGTCSVACDTDENCPDGSHCISKEGGVCLLACELPADCRGGGYTCKGESNKGHGGDSLVCIE